MNFLQYDLGRIEAGMIVEVTLSAAANVRLMEPYNFGKFSRGESHRYIGGYVTRSPYKLRIPSTGRWYVTVDLGGSSGRVSASVQTYPDKLPAASPSIDVQEDSEPSFEEVVDSKMTNIKKMDLLTLRILKDKVEQFQASGDVSIADEVLDILQNYDDEDPRVLVLKKSLGR